MPETTNPPPDRTPKLFLLAILGLFAIGLSAIARGDELVESAGTARKQLIWFGISLPVFLAAAAVPYRRWVRWSYPILAALVLLLIAVFVFPPRNGSRRWIPLGLFYLQPSEVAKVAFILALASYLRFRKNVTSFWGLIPPFLIALVPMGLILVEPDLGTSMLFLPTLTAMVFAAGARVRHLAIAALVGLAFVPVLWMNMGAYQKARVVAVFTQNDGGEAPRGDGYHLHQSKRVLALGGLWGSEISGMRSSDPLDYHLPAGRTDFIFCLVGERWGFAGCCVTLGLYLMLFERCMAIARTTRDPFGRLIVVGVATLILTQVVINTAMTVGLMPITGITLPLMSYGGSSLISTMAALGLIVNVALRPGHEVCPEPFRYDIVGHRASRRTSDVRREHAAAF